MNDRFFLEWNSTRIKIDNLLQHVGFEKPLIEASRLVSGLENTRDISAVKQNLQSALVGPGIPWVFYDTISELIGRVPEGSKQMIMDIISIDTKRDFERLRVDTDGRWQIAWEIEPEADDPQDKYVALDWYVPTNQDQAPIVPIAIVDYIAGCVSLIRKKLVLPGAALLTIAMEAALWNGLQKIGIFRSDEKITYAPTNWILRRLRDKFLLSIQGAEQSVNAQIDPIVGNPEHEFSLIVRRTQFTRDQHTLIIHLEAESNLADFLTSGQVEDRKTVFTGGLSEAIQRARTQSLPGLKIVPSSIDETIIRLRNNLIHLSSDDNLHEPIPIPYQPPIGTLGELRSNPRLIKMLLYSVVEVINSVYSIT
jgi:hypothetical protein